MRKISYNENPEGHKLDLCSTRTRDPRHFLCIYKRSKTKRDRSMILPTGPLNSTFAYWHLKRRAERYHPQKRRHYSHDVHHLVICYFELIKFYMFTEKHAKPNINLSDTDEIEHRPPSKSKRPFLLGEGLDIKIHLEVIKNRRTYLQRMITH